MTIIERYKAWRKGRIIKAAIAAGLTVPSNANLRKGWIPRFWRADYTLYNSELIFSAVSRLANSLSSMPVQLYRGTTPIKNDLNDLVSSSPNTNMPSCQFFRTLETCRASYGNCYALKVYNSGGEVERLDVLNPDRVKPILERDSGEIWYKITPEKEAEQREYYIHNFNVIHIPFISANGISGINPVTVLNDTLEYNSNIQSFSKELLEKGVNSAVVLEAPANLGEEQKKRMVESFIQTYKETSGNVLLLESGVTAKSLDLSPVDSKIFEVEKISRSRVAMVYNIPPHLLGDYSDSSFSSNEQQMLEFLQLTMLPIVTAYEQELDRKLLTRQQRKTGLHWKLDMNALLRADAATSAEVNYKGVRGGWILPDEARAQYHYPPLPGGIGKKALVSQDLAPLDYTVNVKPQVLAAKLNPPAKEDANNGNVNERTNSTS